MLCLYSNFVPNGVVRSVLVYNFSKHEPLPVDQAEADPLLAEVLAWWRGFPTLPSRRDVDPLSLPRPALAKLMLCDLEAPVPPETVPRVRIRLAGTEVCTSYGRELSGFYIHELYKPQDLATAMAAITRMMEDRRPDLVARQMESRHESWLSFKRLMVPLSDDGGANVTGLITVTVRRD